MTSLADTELLRGRWRRLLERHAIDTVNRDDFAIGSLATRLRTPSVQLLVLPADPEADVLHFDGALWAWLETQKSVEIDSQTVRFGDRKCPPRTRQHSRMGTRVKPGTATLQFIDRVLSNSGWEIAVHGSGKTEKANLSACST